MTNKTAAKAGMRQAAHDLYMKIFDSFAIYAPEMTADDHKVVEHLIASKLIVSDVVNQGGTGPGENERVWQCWQTYDDHTTEQAEALFNEMWDEYLQTDKATTPAGRACRCGCGGQRAPKRLFLPGHDARFASHLVNDVKAGEMAAQAAIDEATSVSDALGRKVAHALRGSRTRAERQMTDLTRAQVNTLGDPVYGYVEIKHPQARKIPAQRFTLGTEERLNINDQADGKGDWLDAEGYAAHTQAYWLKRFHVQPSVGTMTASPGA